MSGIRKVVLESQTGQARMLEESGQIAPPPPSDQFFDLKFKKTVRPQDSIYRHSPISQPIAPIVSSPARNSLFESEQICLPENPAPVSIPKTLSRPITQSSQRANPFDNETQNYSPKAKAPVPPPALHFDKKETPGGSSSTYSRAGQPPPTDFIRRITEPPKLGYGDSAYEGAGQRKTIVPPPPIIQDRKMPTQAAYQQQKQQSPVQQQPSAQNQVSGELWVLNQQCPPQTQQQSPPQQRQAPPAQHSPPPPARYSPPPPAQYSPPAAKPAYKHEPVNPQSIYNVSPSQHYQQPPPTNSRINQYQSNEQFSKHKQPIRLKQQPKPPLLVNPNWQQHIESDHLLWSSTHKLPLQCSILLSTLKSLYGGRPRKAYQESSKSQSIPSVVSPPHPLTEHLKQYTNPTIRQSLENAMKGFPVYRKIRGDGNCFYRAFICGYLEMALVNSYATYFLRLLFEFYRTRDSYLTDCQDQEIMQPAEMFHFMMHRLLQLYTYRVDLTEKKDPEMKTKVIDMLYKMLNDKPFQFDMYLVIGIKSYVKTVVEKEPKYAEFGQEIRQGAMRDIMSYGLECEDNEIVIMGLCNSLMVNITLFFVQRQSNQITQNEFRPQRFRRGFEVVLFYRPGHYDLIYSAKTSSIIYPNQSESVRSANNRGRDIPPPPPGIYDGSRYNTKH